jgi:hypothetical protein
MIKKTFYFLLAIYLAWYGGPLLTQLFWFLPVAELAEALTPTKILMRGISFYISFAVWTLLLWLALQATGLVFMPAGIQKYSETPLARFFKGILGEFAVLALIAAPVFWFVFSFGGRSTVVQEIAGGQSHPELVWIAASFWKKGFWVVVHLWRVALPMAVLLHLAFHRQVKKRIGRLAEPVLRFRDRGRAGQGGSARFAGILEEWSLIN